MIAGAKCARPHNPEGLSLAQQLVAREPDWASSLTPAELAALEFDWRFWARPAQCAPDWDWRGWLILAGRAWGKTRTASEWVKEQVYAGAQFIALIGATSADVRDVMVLGKSGLLNVFSPEHKPRYEVTKGSVLFHTGARAKMFSAEEPDALRGPEHEIAWFDEPAKWRYLEDTWANAMMGLRAGRSPKWVGTTTPLPLALLRQLLLDPTVAATRGTTYDNASNLPPAFYEQILREYEGTRLGRQELLGEILDDVPGAIFKASWFRHLAIGTTREQIRAQMRRVLVVVDPAISTNHDETGIAVVGCGVDGLGYVLEDLSGRYSPLEWGDKVAKAFAEWRADLVIAETNRGGDMVEHVVRTALPGVKYREVRAFRGKGLRAEPVAALYEKGRVLHMPGLNALEDQMTTWDPHATGKAAKRAKSPDRLDAVVHGLDELLLGGAPARLSSLSVSLPKSRI